MGFLVHSQGMSEDDKYPSEKAERFQVRLPPGLRDRIKAYAERHGRSMNTEIVRVLEREFPEQWPIGDRLDQLADVLSVLKAGATDQRINQFVANFEETVEGVISGRVTGLDAAVRDRVESMWRAYKDRLDEEEYKSAKDALSDLDDEEYRMFERTGRTDKFAEPRPQKKELHEMTPEDLRINVADQNEDPEDDDQ